MPDCVGVEYATLNGQKICKLYNEITNFNDDPYPYSCPMQCKPGYFLEGEICVLHTNLTCASDEFLLTGSSLFDTECVKCQTCEGKRQVRNCSRYKNAQCEECEFKAFTEFLHNNCTEQCMKDYVFNEETNVCEYCANFKCLPGFYTPVDALFGRITTI